MKRKCGCTFWIACDYHSQQFDEIDQDIDRRFLHRANKRIEHMVNAPHDDWSEFKRTVISAIVAGLICLIMLVVYIGGE